MPEQFDVVELLVDLPEPGLYAGMQGTIIDVHGAGVAYEGEFTNEQGEAIDSIPLRPDYFVVVWEARTQRWVLLAERVAALAERLPEAGQAELLDFARFHKFRASQQQRPTLSPGIRAPDVIPTR